MIFQIDSQIPKLASDLFVAPNAMVMGDVTIGEGSGVWFGSILRGDVNRIEIGRRCNIQDMCMIHVTGGKHATLLGDNCTLGHRVTLHGCELKDWAFVGIGATVLDGCELGEMSFLAAGSLLPPGKKIPPRMMAMGSPAKIVREITPEEESMIRRTVENYYNLRERYRVGSGFKPVEPG